MTFSHTLPAFLKPDHRSVRSMRSWARALTIGAVVCANATASAAVVYFTQGDNAVRQVSDAGAVSTFATSGLADHGDGLAIDGHGNLYVTYDNQPYINKFALAGGAPTVAYSGLRSGAKGLAVDDAGNLYVAEAAFNDVIKIAPGGSASTLASDLHTPYGIAVDATGTVYVANLGDNTISKITAPGTVNTLASGLNGPGQVALAHGSLYVANTRSNQVLRIESDGVITPYVAGLNDPTALAFDSSGNLYVGNYANDGASGTGNLAEVTPDRTVTQLASDVYAVNLASPVPEPSTMLLPLILLSIALVSRAARIESRAKLRHRS